MSGLRAPGESDPVATMAVRHLGEPVGELFVVPGPDRPMGRDDRRLLADLAAQSGPALRAVALSAELTARLDEITPQSEELAASRQRFGVAQSQERRRLQRDLHDGVQQRLVASAIQLGPIRGADRRRLRGRTRTPRELDASLRSSLDDIRELSARPASVDAGRTGLLAALRSRASVSGSPSRSRPTVSTVCASTHRETRRLLLLSGGAAERCQARPRCGGRRTAEPDRRPAQLDG